MRLFFRQMGQQISVLLIAVVLLQFIGGNMGEHQLHLGDHEEELENHPHLQFTVDVASEGFSLGCMLPESVCSDSLFQADIDFVHKMAHLDTADPLFVSQVITVSAEVLHAQEPPAGTDNTDKQPRYLFSQTDTEDMYLCLDCQCHGGHATTISMVAMTIVMPLGSELSSVDTSYFPPESSANHRPPIA